MGANREFSLEEGGLGIRKCKITIILLFCHKLNVFLFSLVLIYVHLFLHAVAIYFIPYNMGTVDINVLPIVECRHSDLIHDY